MHSSFLLPPFTISAQSYNFFFIYASARVLFYKKSAFSSVKTKILNSQFSILNYFYYLCTVIWNNMGFCQKNRNHKLGSILNSQFSILNLLLLPLLLCVSCSKGSIPKPYGYYRITVPDTAYTDFSSPSGGWGAYPYTFALSKNAVVQPRSDEPFWINLYYPALDATIHCSYKPVKNNLRELTNDALEFVYRNASFANAIPEREYTHPEVRVYGVLFDLEGNTASSCQFFITDSVKHFFRASVYCNCPPNADSLAPVYEYLRTDIVKMVETFEWTK